MTALRPCRWDLLADMAALMNGADHVEAPRCDADADHMAIVQRRLPGLSITVDAEVCEDHLREAEGVAGYQRSIKLRAPAST